jgi:hypothetical protein
MADTPKKEGILQTMVRPYVETYKGMTDPEYRYDNFPTTYEDYINKIVVNEDGINRMTGKDREFYLNHEPTLNEFIRQKNMRADPAMASKLSGESGYGRFSRGATNALADTAQLAAILPNDLPGEFLDDVFTMENIGRLRRDYVVDEETAAKFDMTVDEANAFIRKHDQMASLGYFGALAASMPIEDILFRAAGSGLMKGGAFAGKKTGELLSDLKYLDEPDAGSLFLNTAKTKPSSLGAGIPYNQPTIINLQDTGVNILNKTEKGIIPKETVEEYVKKNNDSFLNFNKKFKLDKTDINAQRKFIKYQNSKLDFFKNHADNPNTEKVWNKIENKFFSIDAKTVSKNKRGITQPLDNNSKMITPTSTIKLGEKYLAMGKNPTNFDTGMPMTIDEWFDPPSIINKIGASPNKRRLALQYGAEFVKANRRLTRKARQQGQGDAWAMSQANKQLQWMKSYERKTGLKKYEEIKDPITNSFRGIKEIDTEVVWLKDGLIPVNNPNSNVVEKTIREHPHFKNTQFLHEGVQDIKRATLTPSIAEDFLNEFDDIYITTMGKEGDKFNFNMFANYVDLASQGKNPTTFAPSTFTNSYVEMHHTKGIINDPLNPTMIQNTSRSANSEAVLILTRFNKNIDNGVDLQKALTQVKEEMAAYPTLRLNIPVGDEVIQVGKNLNPKETSKILKKDILKKYNALKETNPNLVKEMGDFFGLGKKTTAQKLDGNSMGGTPISRTFYKDGDRVRTDYDIFKESDIDPIKPSTIPGTIQYAVKQALDPVQKDVRQMYEERVSQLSESFSPYSEFIDIKKKGMEKIFTDRLNPPQPVKFKFSDLPKLATQNPLFTQAKAGPRVPALEIVEFLYNGVRSGTENDIEMKKYFPKVYDMYERAKATGVQETPKEQEYISMIDEFNRAQASGAKRLMFSVVDLAAGITDTLVPDFLLKTEFTDEVRRQFSEADMAEPETFLGKLGAIAIEYGVPGGAAIKFTNVLRKLISTKKHSAFARKTYGKNYKPGITEISNVAKRSGSLAVSFGIGDFVASGPYNTLSTMFDDPLLSSKLVGKLENTDGLSGKDLVKANFKNRLRFGAEGAMIGGLFPIVGPAIGAIAKPLLLKPALVVGGLGVRATGAVLKGSTYLAANTPVVKDIGQGLARGTLDVASLLGKDIIARIGAGVLGGKGAFAASFKKGVAGQLPDYKDWRIFDVTSTDPLKKGLKRFDNFLKWFRDSGNQAVNKFYLDGGASRYITSKSREIESYLDSVEKRAYDLAKGFQNRYNKGSTSPAGEKYFLEQVYEFMRGGLKKSQLPDELQDYAQALKDTFDGIKKTYVSELPAGGGLRETLETNLDKYMRMSFATFNNAAYKAAPEVINKAVDFMVNVIRKNEDLKETALRGSNLPAQQAIRNFAQQNVDSIIALGKKEGGDPLDLLNRINKEFVRNDDIIINTGEELPKVIRELLGQEVNLRNSVMTTAGSLVTQTSNLRSWRETAKQGLRDGYLFETRAEATAAGIIDSSQIKSVPGLGLLESEALASKGGPIGLYGSREMVNTFAGTGGMLDNLLQNEFYQGIIAYKAAVQTGKTVFSPATQTRNFFSAGAFPMYNGHIGGGASVTDSFKIIMDDIFGAGKAVNETDLIKRTQRKIELGVLDENIVASELNAILQDLKKGSFKSFRDLANAANNSKFYKQATRVYAGGDNVWKWYGHEFYMSQLKGVGFKSFDDVANYMKNTHGIELNPRNINTGAVQTLEDGLEEAAAFLLRETYPTYSKVPELIKALRKLPLGNFVSFTAEILRTGFASASIALKHIASENPALREIGYRSLAGQAITLGALNKGVEGIGYAMTNVTQGNVGSYQQFFAPDYMKYSSLVPTSNIKDGVFTVFDMSRFNPYDILVASGNSLLASHERNQADVNIAEKKEEYKTLLEKGIDPSSEEMKARRFELKELKTFFDANRKLDSNKIATNVFQSMFRTTGPLWDAATGTFLSIPIGVEAFVEARTGKTREGATIWNDGMLDTEKFDRAMAHFFTTIEPGIVSTGKRIFNALQGDASGSGQPIEFNSEIIKLLGGSDVKIDIPGSFDYKVGDFSRSLVQPTMGTGYYSTKDWRQRGPEQLVREYRKQNEQAFRQQYEFYKMVKSLRANDFMSDSQIMKVLSDRNLSKVTIQAIMSGKYRAVGLKEGGLKGRYEKIKRNTKLGPEYGFSYFLPLGALNSEKNKWEYKSFSDMEEKITPPKQQSAVEAPVATQEISQAPPPVAPLPESKPVDVAAAQPAAGVVDQATGLTSTESALLDRDEQLIRQRQRGTV